MLNLATPSLAPLESASTRQASLPDSLPTTLTAPPGRRAAGTASGSRDVTNPYADRVGDLLDARRVGPVDEPAGAISLLVSGKI